MNILATLSENLISFNVEKIGSITLEGIGYVIKWIFDLFNGFPCAVALGVIVFTLMLKTLVLPLDIYSRVNTKKQSLLMKEMRPQMEKLQLQYANDKNMYNQKVMELQKANGYNPLGACLPSIISIVIFMIVFSSFTTYSNYASLATYNNLVDAYNDSVTTYVRIYEDAEYQGEESNRRFLIAVGEDYNALPEGCTFNDEGIIVNVNKERVNVVGYKVDFSKFTAYYGPIYDNLYKNDEGYTPFDADAFSALTEAEKMKEVADFVHLNARDKAAECYRENRSATSFGWIGNMWYPDSMLNKELPSYSEFSNSIARASSGTNASYEESYNEVTYNLSREKDTFNGYFVLIVLSIGFMFLQQFVMMKSQKDANELSTVDGSGASTNKMMTIMMPLIFGIFSFFYSAAFSVYMITNTVYGLITTLIINKILTARFNKNGTIRKQKAV